MYVYIIEAVRTGKKNLGKIIYYTGITNNPKKRFQEHCLCIKSNWMRKYKILPRGIVYLEELRTYEEAIKREKQIKRMSLIRKKELIKIYNTH